MISKTLSKRFWAKVRKTGPIPRKDATQQYPEIKGLPCWIFTAKKSLGYGYIRVNTLMKHAMRRAHIVAWYLRTGKWPKQNILHKCDRTDCVRFAHLFEGSQADNIHDMVRKHRARGRLSAPKEVR